MQNPQTRLETDSETQDPTTTQGRPGSASVDNDTGKTRTDASSGPLLPQSQPTPGDPNYHGGRRMLGTSLGMFLPALILLIIGVAIIVYIAW